MPKPSVESLPDHTGEHYLGVLRRLHDVLKPRAYLEIGTNSGESLALARCSAIAVDPAFSLRSGDFIAGKSVCALYQMRSDEFFRSIDPTKVLGSTIDIAFLDGMHLSEFLLRDFANTERFCRRNSIIALHDCLPVESAMANRTPGATPTLPHRAGWWTGDVWRTLWILKHHRPDLSFTVLDSFPTGLVLITNLQPQSTFLLDNYESLLAEMMSLSLANLGLENLAVGLAMQSTSVLATPEQISSRYWL